MILTPLINERKREIFSLIEIMRGIKGASARAINECLGRHGPVWQEESFDHVLRSSEGLDAKRLFFAEPGEEGIGQQLD